jgi:hypothetical protein
MGREIRFTAAPELHKRIRLACAELDVSTARLVELALDALDAERLSPKEAGKRGAA